MWPPSSPSTRILNFRGNDEGGPAGREPGSTRPPEVGLPGASLRESRRSFDDPCPVRLRALPWCQASQESECNGVCAADEPQSVDGALSRSLADNVNACAYQQIGRPVCDRRQPRAMFTTSVLEFPHQLRISAVRLTPIFKGNSRVWPR